MGYWFCGIYDERPDSCKIYPERDSYIPEGCGFWHSGDGERQGSCDPECSSTCCRLPREGGEPGGAALPWEAGGEACRHLVYGERHPAHGEVPGEREADTESGGDREEHRPEPDPIELALAEIDRRKGRRPSSP